MESDGEQFTAPADGFDEGEPLRRWTARAADGDVIARALGRSFIAPRDTVTVEVVVGGRVELAHVLREDVPRDDDSVSKATGVVANVYVELD